MSETESEADDLWQLHLEEIGDKLNAENDRTGFLRMVNRNHIFNASSYRYEIHLSLGLQNKQFLRFKTHVLKCFSVMNKILFCLQLELSSKYGKYERH